MSVTKTFTRRGAAATLAAVTSIACYPGIAAATAVAPNQPGASASGAAVMPTPATLYSADWSAGLNGWAGSGAWKTLNGMLLSDGTENDDVVTAPWVAAEHADYAVEAEIRVNQGMTGHFGLFARRALDDSGYRGAIGRLTNSKIFNSTSRYYSQIAEGDPFAPDEGWHRYRLEVRGNVITFSVDGASLVTVIDNRYLSGGRVGLYSSSQQMEIRSFRVSALKQGGRQALAIRRDISLTPLIMRAGL
ncbi:family 16 glycoside hydrolase [Actinoplanes aureus]|uniref:DUF1080 domain-containing protein n=1 Tax=Actinoplanes aureus TaxID=2792083 RepID=A0A931CMS3_9ACTN|nr:family 16 glycoside hydrolase [Actinoplanes aureus]MBG0569261.1 DUF1080 domain-containing protein [Actinoplanes aureus]